jgi:hypothetical protein
MSKVKTPREKKDLSLERDRRNRYGENDKASRKRLPLKKQEGRQRERSSVKMALGQLKGEIQPDFADQVESEVRTRTVTLRRKAPKKVPDVPLGEVLRRKKRPRGLAN